jgi:maleylpyruvate isomerase
LRIALRLKVLEVEYVPVETAVNTWCASWIAAGFDAFEAVLAARAERGDFCFGDTPTRADVFPVPQVESARPFKVDLKRWPRIQAIDAACARLEAFRLSAPALQPDAT